MPTEGEMSLGAAGSYHILAGKLGTTCVKVSGPSECLRSPCYRDQMHICLSVAVRMPNIKWMLFRY